MRVKLATWNCCGGFDDKLAHLLDLDVDVAVVCEGRTPTTWPTAPNGRRVTGIGHRVWAESWKELVVLAVEPWSIALHEEVASAPAWTAPVRVTGPVEFTLMGLWPVVFPATPSYVAQIERAVEWIERHSRSEPTVLIGDFNAPIASTQAQYDHVEAHLNALGLEDAYRSSRGLTRGERPVEGTYYQHRRLDRPFHIDHAFVPASWLSTLSVEVGDHATWVGSGRSDHSPLFVEVEDDAQSRPH